MDLANKVNGWIVTTSGCKWCKGVPRMVPTDKDYLLYVAVTKRLDPVYNEHIWKSQLLLVTAFLSPCDVFVESQRLGCNVLSDAMRYIHHLCECTCLRLPLLCNITFLPTHPAAYPPPLPPPERQFNVKYGKAASHWPVFVLTVGFICISFDLTLGLKEQASLRRFTQHFFFLSTWPKLQYVNPSLAVSFTPLQAP